MQICGHDALAIKFSNSSCYDIVSYDATFTSLLINYYAKSDFYTRMILIMILPLWLA
jgi:hypothetical protein